MELLTATKPAAGTALLPRLYTDERLLEAEQRLIFERTWQLAGHVSQVPRPGSYLTASAGDQPVLVVRDEQNELRAYRNVCRHRASRLLSDSGQCKGAIRCRYHGWTYRFDGTLIGVPEGMSFGERLDKGSLGLFPVRIEEFCGLVFVNLDPDAAPLAELVDGLAARLAPYRIPTLEPFGPGGDGQPANWKVVAENYMEGYHIPIAHPGLMRMLDYKHYDVEVHDNYVWFDAPMRAKPSSNRLERLYDQLVEPMPGLSQARPPDLALCLHLSEHDHRPVPGPGQHMADPPRRRRADQRRVGGISPSGQRRADPVRAVDQHAAEQPGAR